MKWLMNWRNEASRRDRNRLEKLNVFIYVLYVGNIIICSWQMVISFLRWSIACEDANRKPIKFHFDSNWLPETGCFIKFGIIWARDGRKLLSTRNKSNNGDEMSISSWLTIGGVVAFDELYIGYEEVTQHIEFVNSRFVAQRSIHLPESN